MVFSVRTINSLGRFLVLSIPFYLELPLVELIGFLFHTYGKIMGQ